MALKKNITVGNAECLDAYIVFDSLQFVGKDASGNRAVHGILHVKKRKGDEEVVAYFDCDFTYDITAQDNLWTQGYLAAKQIPELSDAEDI